MDKDIAHKLGSDIIAMFGKTDLDATAALAILCGLIGSFIRVIETKAEDRATLAAIAAKTIRDSALGETLQ